MPSIATVANTLVPAGMTIAQYLAAQRGLNSATQTVQQGATAAGQGLNNAAQVALNAQGGALTTQQGIASGSVDRTDAATAAALKAQQEALDRQNGLYQTTVDANAPYSEFGRQSIAQLQALQANPGSITSNPGYQFEMSEGLKGGQRAASASGTLGNGGTIKSQTRYALDYASTKYQQALDNLNRSAGFGERANAANASAGVTLGNQTQQNANEVGAINRTGANENNATMATLGTQTGQNANNVTGIVTGNAENQAGLTLAQAELQAKNQSAQGTQTAGLIDTLGKQAPTILKALGIGGSAAAAGGGAAAGGVAAAGAGMIGSAGLPIGLSTAGGLGAAAGPTIAGAGAAPATGLAGALGLGGGSGLFGLGAATIPVVGGLIAGGVLLANHFIGEGRKAADKLTGQGGIQHAFEDTLKTIDSQPGYTEAQKWQSKEQAYEKLKDLALQFAKKGSNEKKTASQLFDTIAPLFGQSNPLKAAA